MTRTELSVRFWRRVSVGNPDQCWPWQGGRNRQGYGKVTLTIDTMRYRTVSAHRVAYELRREPIPPGFLVCHHCDNPPCCNPAHLFIGRHIDNSRDMYRKDRYGKVTRAQVLAIRRDYRPGLAVQLAQKYNMTTVNLRMIAKGQVWNHIR